MREIMRQNGTEEGHTGIKEPDLIACTNNHHILLEHCEMVVA